MRRYRKNIYENENARTQYRKKEAERKKRERAAKKICMTAEQRKIEKNKEKERRRRWRNRVKQHMKEKVREEVAGLWPYSCKQTLGKAICKIKNALPKNPEKQKTVIAHLAYEKVPDLIIKKKQNARHSYSTETIEHVKMFYARDDISRQAPGKRDTKSVKNPNTGEREMIQKRHMIMTIKEAFSLYTNEFQDKNVKLSKFYDLRPQHVLLSSEMPHNVCVCRYHANFDFLVEAVHKIIPSFPATCKILLEKVCCSFDSDNCRSNSCFKCEKDLNYAFMPLKYSFLSNEIVIKWKKWTDVEKRVEIQEKEGTLADAVKEMEDQLSYFKTHCYVKSIQEKYFDTQKQLVSEKRTAVIQIDFAENYSLTSQNEIQSAHWTHKQVTIFTCVMWIPEKIISLAIISDYLSHDKYAVYIFLKKIFQKLKEELLSYSYYGLQKILIFSDGCAAQFKNKFTLSNLCYMESDFDLPPVEWNFFATSHGKGAVDAIGGNVKRTVWREVKSKNLNILNAAQFLECAQNHLSSTHLILTEVNEIEEIKPSLDNRWANVKSIRGIQSKHYFYKLVNGILQTAQTASSPCESAIVFQELKF